jgi:rod shape-determining protein MreC
MKVFATKHTKWQYIKKVIKRVLVFFIAILAAVIIIIGKSDSKFVLYIKNTVINTASPIIYVMTWPFRKVDEGVALVNNAFYNSAKILKMEQDIDKYKSEISNLQYLKSENFALRQALNFVPEYAKEFLTTAVRFDDGGFLSQSFIVDAGENMGVQNYQPAVVSGAYIGQVSSVGADFSRITLITDSRSRIPVMIERNRVRAFLVGDNTGYPRLEHFESKDPIIVGDRIITSGLEEKTPKGIIVGTVIQDSVEDGILVQPIVDKPEIEFIQIIKKFNIKTFEQDKIFRYKQ